MKKTNQQNLPSFEKSNEHTWRRFCKSHIISPILHDECVLFQIKQMYILTPGSLCVYRGTNWTMSKKFPRVELKHCSEEKMNNKIMSISIIFKRSAIHIHHKFVSKAIQPSEKCRQNVGEKTCTKFCATNSSSTIHNKLVHECLNLLWALV